MRRIIIATRLYRDRILRLSWPSWRIAGEMA
ncbi:MAG: hypothetical protein H6R18_1913 [Proteobacteria bacterium]|nr:hypothetical protein [Pseudomonadota bacterium]